MDKLSLRLLGCAVADASQTIGPYLQDHLVHRGRSRNGLGIFLSSDEYIVFHVGDAGRSHPSTSESERMVPFTTITLVPGRALPGGALEGLTLDLIAHTPREEIIYFRTCGSLEVARDLRIQMPNLKALDLVRVPLSAVFPTMDQDISYTQEKFPPSLQHLFLE